MESDEYGIRRWPISKPARPRRKPKPDAMLARCRLSIVLSTIHQTPKATSATNQHDLEEMPRTLGSLRNEAFAGSCARDDMLHGHRGSPSAKAQKAGTPVRPGLQLDQRIGGAYCRPPLVHSALMPRAILSGVAGADVALEDLAVVADALDDVDDPVVGQAEIGADLGVGLDAEHALDLRDSASSSSPRHWPG